MPAKKGSIFIGTSNIVIPGNKMSFPEAFREKSRLHYYGHLFNSLEVNSSFYKIPLPATLARWSAEVPDNFRFSLKLSKEITHVKDLKADLGILNKFLGVTAGMGKKKGCILIQFPGKISLDYFEQVEQILALLDENTGSKGWKTAVEFRNPGWYTGETYELLNEYRAALVLQDFPKSKFFEPGGKAGFSYIRFHGPEGNYRHSYTDAFLEGKRDLVLELAAKGKDVYVYFNNSLGSAFENARTLQKMVSRLPA